MSHMKCTPPWLSYFFFCSFYSSSHNIYKFQQLSKLEYVTFIARNSISVQHLKSQSTKKISKTSFAME